ncbi:hypothetical protein GGS23DRAFT_251859 [Durotheca rogersii]|uniref:uncharacterized protein n=1 Tax=Durotheca rogersii TaxID=419775 RepID=UPI002220050A|nr:uncharacterized protein GGS23DRAFT_251859 [Durotheca rogersii]KAI5860157.1 hypothetical protein GGS23DRAFT_251859 [Durotheca rogersii]
MSTHSGKRPASRNYDTGFPDAFAEYTTSLRHPEANTNPGACISAEDVDPSRTLQRTRRSFLAKKKKKYLSHGVITQLPNLTSSNTSISVLPGSDSAVDVGTIKRTGTSGSIGRSSKDGAESLGLSSNGGSSPSSPTTPDDDDLHGETRRGPKLFRKWLSQKD